MPGKTGNPDESDKTCRGRILLVDDEPLMVELMVNLLEEEGHEIITAPDGETALENLDEEERLDLILLDIMMPGLDGFEICRMIKENPKTSHIPVVIVTAKNEDISRLRAIHSGADGYIAKPFSLDELVWKVNAYLNQTREGQPDEGSVSSVHGADNAAR